jgi:uncharacterized spore protein YtfJ
MRMSIPERIQSIVDRIQGSASVKTVYGEPIKVDGRTIIPVARVAYGFGMCSCGNSGEDQEKQGKATGGCGGGGGGLSVNPIGVVEVAGGETRYIPIGIGAKLAGALIVGIFLGILIVGKRSRH